MVHLFRCTRKEGLCDFAASPYVARGLFRTFCRTNFQDQARKTEWAAICYGDLPHSSAIQKHKERTREQFCVLFTARLYLDLSSGRRSARIGRNQGDYRIRLEWFGFW